MAAHVYLLRHATEPRFKIGKANDLAARVLQLGRSQFNLLTSIAIEVESPEDAINLERLLHRAFWRHRLNPARDSTGYEYPGLAAGKHDGMTEWFSAACWERLQELLTHLKDLIAHTQLPSDHCALAVPLGLEAPRRTPKAALRARYSRYLECADTRAERLSHFLGSLCNNARFAVVVSMGSGRHRLVGESKRSCSAGNRKLLAQLIKSEKWEAGATGHRFYLDLPGEPGLEVDNAPDEDSFRDRVLWSHELAIPGFDLPVSWKETKHASVLLTAGIAALQS